MQSGASDILLLQVLTLTPAINHTFPQDALQVILAMHGGLKSVTEKDRGGAGLWSVSRSTRIDVR